MGHARHCASLMRVHLVFVAKYRREVFDSDAGERLRRICAKVSTDFEAELVEFDGEDDHVHLLVEYPLKTSVSALRTALKGVSSRLLQKRETGYRSSILEKRALVAFLFRRILRRCSDKHCAPVHRRATDTGLTA